MVTKKAKDDKSDKNDGDGTEDSQRIEVKKPKKVIKNENDIEILGGSNGDKYKKPKK